MDKYNKILDQAELKFFGSMDSTNELHIAYRKKLCKDLVLNNIGTEVEDDFISEFNLVISPIIEYYQELRLAEIDFMIKFGEDLIKRDNMEDYLS